MGNFLRYIFSFVQDLFVTLRTVIFQGSAELVQEYDTFLSKQIINGDLISIGMTWRELLLFGSTWFLIVFFIVFFIKLIFKVIGLVCLK